MVYPDEISRIARTTATGTSYQQVLAQPLGGQADDTLVLVPDSVADGSVITVVYVYHGYQGNQGSVNATKMVGTRDALLDRGYVVISPNAFGDNWANDAFLQAAAACDTWAESIWDLGTKFLHGTSMGGLGAALVLATETVTPIAAVAMVDPAVNLQSDYTYSPDYRASIQTAYGFTSYASQWATATAGHDPMLRPASEYTNSWIYIWASPDDASIPKSLNADQFKANFQGVTYELTVQATTGGHVQPSHFQPDVLLAFYDRSLGEPPVAPPELLVVGAEYYFDANRHRWIAIQEFSSTIDGQWVPLVS